MALPYGAIAGDETWRMEQFSRAYVQAVACAAGFKLAESQVDDDSIDLTLVKRTVNTPVRSPKLDVQLKATHSECVVGDQVVFPLSIKNYNELRAENYLVPRIL